MSIKKKQDNAGGKCLREKEPVGCEGALFFKWCFRATLRIGTVLEYSV